MDNSPKPEPSTQPASHSSSLRSLRASPITSEPLKQQVQNIFGKVVETGRLPGAPTAHQKLADYVEYTQAIVNSTTAISEAITMQDYERFAFALPCFAGMPGVSKIDVKDTDNFQVLDRCIPRIGDYPLEYIVSSESHPGKLLTMAAMNPRAIEWMLMLAIMAQRGLYQKVVEMLLEEKESFIRAVQEDQGEQFQNVATYQAIISYSATLERLITSFVTTLRSLDLGQLGGELNVQGSLPRMLDFDHYVTADPIIYTVAKEAEAIGCQFHGDVLLVESIATPDRSNAKRARRDPMDLAKDPDMGRLQRIDILRTAPGSGRYSIINAGPTGRAPHARLVSGLVKLLMAKVGPPAARQNFIQALERGCQIPYALAVDLKTGIADIVVGDDDPKGLLEYPEFSIENDLPPPANITLLADLLELAPHYELAYLDFTAFAHAGSGNWNLTVLVFLVVKGWWWSLQLVRDLPQHLLVPNHAAYFSAMASLGAVMLHLEQQSKCLVTTNGLFDPLRLLTNLGAINPEMTTEAVTYAAQGPGGTIVHDILGGPKVGWSVNPHLNYRWLSGRFMGIPEVALLGEGCSWRKYIPTQLQPLSDPEAPGDTTLHRDRSGPSITIYADSTDGHTLACAIVTSDHRIRSLPYTRVLCGHLLAYIKSDPNCNHTVKDFAGIRATLSPQAVSWSDIEARYYGLAEVEADDVVLVTGVENSKAGQVMALAVTQECTAINTDGCMMCAFSRSKHVVRTALRPC